MTSPKRAVRGLAQRVRPRSVRAKFLLINVTLVVAASLGAFTVFEYYNYRQEMAELTDKKTRLLQSQVEILAPALWQDQRPQVQHILSVLVTDPDVVGAEVRDAEGTLFGAVGMVPEQPAGNPALVGTQPIKYFANASYVRIGSLDIAMTDRQALAHLRRSTLLAAAMTGMLVLAAIASAMIAHWRTIGIPLKRLQHAIDSGRHQGGEVRPKVGWHSDDEIGAVVRAYNDLQDVQARHEARLRAAWDEAETAKVRAEAATRAKSAFLANMSHEIRTPMNAVLGFADLLRRQDLTAPQHEYIEMIHASGSNLLGILNDILDFSKIEAGRMELAEAAFEVETLLAHVAAVSALGTEDKGLDLFLRRAPAVPPKLYGDAGRLEQMLVNLVNNAVKFTETGHVRLDIDRLDDAGDGDAPRIRFAVSDTGIGIDAKTQAQLFRPFAQADDSATRQHGGTGLGLAIVGKLTELMNGTIDVDSTPGEGSTFAVTVPLKPATSESAAPAHELSGTRALVAEDHPGGAAIVAEILRDRRAKVDTVATAEAAREAVQNRSYDLVLLDWDVAGPDMARAQPPLPALAADVPGRPAVVVVAGTRARETVRERAAEHGVTRMLTKPLLATPLLQEVSDALGMRAGSPEEPQADAGAPAGIREHALAGRCILLVEDNEINQEVAHEILEAAGARVMIAEHGQAALDRLAPEADGAHADVVLMDVQMPVLDGCAATEHIRAREAERGQPRRPIIAMTAHAMATEREACLAAGMDDHVGKPIDPDDLVQTIAAWLPSRAQISA